MRHACGKNLLTLSAILVLYVTREISSALLS